MIITIDGLSINGKSTLAEMISKEMGIKNLNSGTIYRCIALEILNKKLDINNIKDVINKISNINIQLDNGKTLLNGIDVSKRIREEEISLLSTKYGIIPEIKQLVRKIQADFIKNNDVIIEGRDIATRIAPNADIKFYIYADFEMRVERLYKQLKNVDIEEVKKELKLRDEIEINSGSFLKPSNAIEIDTTNIDVNEVFEIMMKEIRKLIKIDTTSNQ